jgi:hypothetical protein
MRRLLVPPATVLALTLAGCGSDSGSSSAQQSTWPGPPKPRADGTIPIADFNAYLAGDGQAFATSPTAAVTEFLGLDDSSAAVTTMRATSPGEVRNFSEVVTTLEGLLDDSVKASRYTVELQRNDAMQWRLRAAEWAQSCQAGRGHQDYSPEPCV